MPQWAPFVVVEELSAQGIVNLHGALSGFSQTYRIISISGYGHPNDPRFAVIWAARPPGAPRQLVRQASGESELKGVYLSGGTYYYPVLVAATGTKGFEPFFVVIAEEGGTPNPPGGLVPYAFPILLSGLDPQMVVYETPRPDNPSIKVPFSDLTLKAGSLGLACSNAKRGLLAPDVLALGVYALPASIARYRSSTGALRVAATFLPQPVAVGVDEFVPWGIDIAKDKSELAAKKNAYLAQPAAVRLDQLVRLHDDPTIESTVPRYAQLWQDNLLPEGWIPEIDIDQARYDEVLPTYRASGYYPIRIDVFDEVGPKRFNVIFAQSDEPIIRTFRRKIRQSKAKIFVEPLAFGKWDDWVERTMARNGIRGAQLAVTFNGRLVFFHAYTRAEPTYPDIDLNTAFNVGSVSKALTSLATLRILDGESSSLAELKQALKANYWTAMGVPAPGWNNPDSRVANLQLQQLITQTSGIRDNYCTEGDDIIIATDRDVDLPLPSDEAWEYFRNLPTVKMVSAGVYGTPALFSAWTYLGIHFFLQERWLQKKTGASDGEKAMKAALFDVVGAARARISTSAAQGVDEVVRHRSYVKSGYSHLTNSLATSQLAYGRRWMPLIAPSGGWSMPADDLARAIASIDWGGGSGRQPLLSASGIALLETVKPFVRSASAPGDPLIQVTYGGQYRRAWTGQDFSTAHNGSLDGGQALMLRLNAPSIGGVLGVAMTLSGNLIGDDDDGFRGPGEGDVNGASGGFLKGAIPPAWPSWDLFDES